VKWNIDLVPTRELRRASRFLVALVTQTRDEDLAKGLSPFSPMACRSSAIPAASPVIGWAPA
jgi:hypothetical protein